MSHPRSFVIALWFIAACATASAAASAPRVIAPGDVIEASLDAGGETLIRSGNGTTLAISPTEPRLLYFGGSSLLEVDTRHASQ